MQGFDQGVNFPASVVKGQGSADGGRNLIKLHGGLCAVVPGAHGDALGVEYRADIVRVDIAEHEGEHGDFLAGGADESEARDFAKGFNGVVVQLGDRAARRR